MTDDILRASKREAMEKYGFGTRTNEQETTEYEVVDIQLYQ